MIGAKEALIYARSSCSHLDRLEGTPLSPPLQRQRSPHFPLNQLQYHVKAMANMRWCEVMQFLSYKDIDIDVDTVRGEVYKHTVSAPEFISSRIRF